MKSINGLERQLKNMYFKKLLFYVLFSILISFELSLKADVVNKIEINGNKRISDQTVILYGKIKTKEDLTEKKLMK